MNTPSNGRGLRPKGKRIKLALQIVSLLAVCFWLLYQAKQSHDKGDYSQNDEAGEIHGSGTLGRKANAGGLSQVEESLKDEDRGGGVDVLGGEVEEKYSSNDDTEANIGRHEGKEGGKEVELIYKELNNTDDGIDIEPKASSEGVDENSLQVGHEDKQGTMANQDGDQKDVKNNSHREVGEDEEEISHVDQDEQGHGRDTQKESESKNEFLVQPANRKNESLQVHGFDDENGVPVDGNDIIESRVTELNSDGEISAHEEMHSSSSSHNEANESTQTEEVIGRGDGDDLKARSKFSVQDSEHEAETNSEASVRIDTSINSVAGTTHRGTSASDL